MVNCPQCQVHNSLDSHFCKGCGASLPQDAVADAQREHEELVAEGYKALNEGRLEEAQLVAISALEQFPESISALSLKGMSQERQGQLAEALETYEKVVELNPNSALDKIKVQHLRQSMSAKLLQAPPNTNRKVAVFAAVAAIVLVGAIGVIAANFANPGADSNESLQDPNRVAMQSSNSNLPIVGQGAAKPGAGETNGGAKTGNANNDPEYVGPEGKKPATGSGGGVVLPNSRGTQLPEVGNGSGFGPLNPNGIGVQPEGGGTQPVGNGNGNGTQGSKPTKPEEEPDPTVGDGGKTASNPPDNPGEIEIKTSRVPGTGNRSGGSEVGNGGDMGFKSLLAAAKQQFQLGKYDQAAKSYERLLSMGADPGSTNQRIGQCYQHLGQNGAAADAYRRAIATFEARLKNSSGDTSGLQSILASCRAALKVVG